ncbi:hypothetical protein [Niallia sp. FSL R7-0271]|uniref:hypothetical protein n=1 Tax=Niallia sp. FSL R7-0271 TaxID=2921678 RepID=UPI0030F7B870
MKLTSNPQQLKENERSPISLLFQVYMYFPNLKRRNLPKYGRIPSFVLLVAWDKTHYVN